MHIENSSFHPVPRNKIRAIRELVMEYKDLLPFWVKSVSLQYQAELDGTMAMMDNRTYCEFVVMIGNQYAQLVKEERIRVYLHEVAHLYTSRSINTMKNMLEKVGADEPTVDIIMSGIIDTVEQDTEVLANLFYILIHGERL